jgi:hypothetical protein
MENTSRLKWRNAYALGLAYVLFTSACGGCAAGDITVIPDAAPAAALPASEVVAGGGRVRNGTMTMDVEIGHGMSQQRTTGGTKSMEGAAVVKP